MGKHSGEGGEVAARAAKKQRRQVEDVDLERRREDYVTETLYVCVRIRDVRPDQLGVISDPSVTSKALALRQKIMSHGPYELLDRWDAFEYGAHVVVGMQVRPMSTCLDAVVLIGVRVDEVDRFVLNQAVVDKFRDLSCDADDAYTLELCDFMASREGVFENEDHDNHTSIVETLNAMIMGMAGVSRYGDVGEI